MHLIFPLFILFFPFLFIPENAKTIDPVILHNEIKRRLSYLFLKTANRGGNLPIVR